MHLLRTAYEKFFEMREKLKKSRKGLFCVFCRTGKPSERMGRKAIGPNLLVIIRQKNGSQLPILYTCSLCQDMPLCIFT